MADLAVEGVDADRVALARGALLGTYDACDGRGAGAEAAWESLVRLERLA